MPRSGSRHAICFCVFMFGLSTGAAAQTLSVSNVEELYSAVNNPANAGATLALAPGTYMLSVNNPNDVPRLNGGRIELQPDMSLTGVEGDSSAVVISAFNLPATSFPQGGGPNAPVRLGLGRNALEWLTVRDGHSAQANIDSGLQPRDPASTFVRIFHVASTGSTRGLNLLNFGPDTSGQTLEAEVIDSQFFDNTFNLSEGVRMGNFQGAVGATVIVRMSGNRSWGQKQGRLIVNNRAVNSTVTVFSSGNRFYDNGAGTIVVGGLSSNNTRADGNTIEVEMHGDHFIGNERETEFDRGGLIVLGTENFSASTGGGSNNTVNVRMWGCRMIGNYASDLLAIGARSLSEATAALSQNNRVTVELYGDASENGRWQPVVFTSDSEPAGPYGNVASVIRR